MADPQTRTRDLLANERTFLAWARTGAERRRRRVDAAIETDRPIETGGEPAAAVVLVGAIVAALVLLLV